MEETSLVWSRFAPHTIPNHRHIKPQTEDNPRHSRLCTPSLKNCLLPRAIKELMGDNVLAMVIKQSEWKSNLMAMTEKHTRSLN
jgi:hypothetical protein